jgi:hypothetical protein
MQINRLKVPTIILAAMLLVIGVSSGAVAAKLITGADVKDGSLTSSDIKNSTLSTQDLKNGAVGLDKLKADSVGTDKIKSQAVGHQKIKANAVDSSKIKDGSVGRADLNAALAALLPTKVTNLTGVFTASNPSVTMSPDGVNFGPYADGGASGGTLNYSGLNGQPLSAVKNLVYYARYMATTATGGVGAPYLRIFLTGDTHDAIFSPDTQQPNPDTAQGPFHEWVATSGSWRYDDDAGNNADESFAALIAAHGAETISGIKITTGFSSGANLQALLRWMQINGETFNFGS